jgi:hypothetical protein
LGSGGVEGDTPVHEKCLSSSIRSALFLGSLLMALYIMFIRPGGVEGTWAFFNLVFVQNLSIFIVNTYSIKIDKTGVKNDSNEGVIAPLVFTILSAVLIYGLADKIYY